MPLLEIVTRCYKRPALLRHNRASVERQTCADWSQTMLVDEVGRGVGWAYDQLAAFTPTGAWVWLLDDDDLCLDADLVRDVGTLAAEFNPDVIMVKMDHGNGAILPDKFTWGRTPQLGHIGVSGYIVKREVWLDFRHAFTPGHHASDFDFIAAIFASDPEVYWHNTVASRVQQIGKGLPE